MATILPRRYKLRLLLLLIVTAATAANSIPVSSFWAMDPRLMFPPSTERATPTAREQLETERRIWARYQQRVAARGNDSCSDSGEQLPFPVETARHVRLLKGVLESFPEHIPKAYATSVPWCCYWCCHALDVLGAAATTIGPALRQRIEATLQRCQQPDGGFAGSLDYTSSSYSTNSSSPSPSHVLSTYAALTTLAILHATKPPSSPYSYPSPLPTRRRLRAFLLSLKHPTDGTFRATPAPDSEVDARSIYGALAVARLAGLLDDPVVVEREKLIEYLGGLQTHEGGFAGEAGDGHGREEAHAGFSYCALASLALLGAVDRVPDWGAAVRWAAHRQRAFEGGCDGRTNKLVDVCYSFWAGALPPLLSLASLSSERRGQESPPPPPRRVLHAGALARYLLAISQDAEAGGFVDKPGADVDYYHTCYALSGLAVAVHDLEHPGVKSAWGGLLEGRVRRVDVPLNLCLETLRAWDAASTLPY